MSGTRKGFSLIFVTHFVFPVVPMLIAGLMNIQDCVFVATKKT
jgi:hypothetical protein